MTAEPDNFNESCPDIMFPQLESSRRHKGDLILKSSIREVMFDVKTCSTPTPLCSMCKHKAPAFGKPPRIFHYKELEEATDGFLDANLLAECGFGVAHRGILRDGQVVAVKQLKFCISQGVSDFQREVRVLTCAQHRTVVLLIGFCVYEYICNGSLHGNKRKPLDWSYYPLLCTILCTDMSRNTIFDSTILEGGVAVFPLLSSDLHPVGSRSGHLQGLKAKEEVESKRHSRRLSH